MIFGRVAKRQPQLRPWMRGTFLTCCVAAAFGFYWTSVRDTVVDERVVTGVPAGQAETAVAGDPLAPQQPSRPAASRENVVELTGPVRPQSHSASGTARVVRLAAGGRRLTLSGGFEIDPGPQVRVYLATDTAAKTFEDIGALKGSRGNQQYAIPAGVDLGRYDTVVFWCVPFTQSLASAGAGRRLTPSSRAAPAGRPADRSAGPASNVRPDGVLVDLPAAPVEEPRTWPVSFAFSSGSSPSPGSPARRSPCRRRRPRPRRLPGSNP